MKNAIIIFCYVLFLAVLLYYTKNTKSIEKFETTLFDSSKFYNIKNNAMSTDVLYTTQSDGNLFFHNNASSISADYQKNIPLRIKIEKVGNYYNITAPDVHFSQRLDLPWSTTNVRFSNNGRGCNIIPVSGKPNVYKIQMVYSIEFKVNDPNPENQYVGLAPNLTVYPKPIIPTTVDNAIEFEITDTTQTIFDSSKFYNIKNNAMSTDVLYTTQSDGNLFFHSTASSISADYQKNLPLRIKIETVGGYYYITAPDVHSTQRLDLPWSTTNIRFSNNGRGCNIIPVSGKPNVYKIRLVYSIEFKVNDPNPENQYVGLAPNLTVYPKPIIPTTVDNAIEFEITDTSQTINVSTASIATMTPEARTTEYTALKAEFLAKKAQLDYDIVQLVYNRMSMLKAYTCGIENISQKIILNTDDFNTKYTSSVVPNNTEKLYAVLMDPITVSNFQALVDMLTLITNDKMVCFIDKDVDFLDTKNNMLKFFVTFLTIANYNVTYGNALLAKYKEPVNKLIEWEFSLPVFSNNVNMISFHKSLVDLFTPDFDSIDNNTLNTKLSVVQQTYIFDEWFKNKATPADIKSKLTPDHTKYIIGNTLPETILSSLDETGKKSLIKKMPGSSLGLFGKLVGGIFN